MSIANAAAGIAAIRGATTPEEITKAIVAETFEAVISESSALGGIWCLATGNDSTADGTYRKPFLTAQAAADVAIPLGKPVFLGVGSFGNVSLTFNANYQKIYFVGIHRMMSDIGDLNITSVDDNGEVLVSLPGVSCNGLYISGLDGASASGDGENGGNGASITAVLDQVRTTFECIVRGGHGGGSLSGSEGTGGNAVVALRECRLKEFAAGESTGAPGGGCSGVFSSDTVIETNACVGLIEGIVI